MNKEQFRIQRGGFCGIPYEETENPTCNSLEIIPAPPVVFTTQQAEEREHRLKAAHTRPMKREYYPAPPCVMAIRSEEDGA